MNRITGRKILTIIFLVILMFGCGSNFTQIDTITEISLELDWQFHDLAWSPDGKSIIAQGTARGKDSTFFIIDLTSETSRTLKEDPQRMLYEALGPEWSPNGQELILYYPAIITPFNVDSHPSSIVILDATTGQPLQDVWEGDYATWGNEANQVLVVDFGPSGQPVPIYLLDLHTQEIREITSARASQVTIFDAFDASSTGNLVYKDIDYLYVVSIDSGEVIGSIYSSNPFLYSPVWVPDGSAFAYIEKRTDSPNHYSYHLILSSPDTSCQSESLNLDEPIISIDWSLDGQQLAFVTETEGVIYFLDLREGIGKEWYTSFQNCFISN